MSFKKSMYHVILSTSQLYFCLKKNPNDLAIDIDY